MTTQSSANDELGSTSVTNLNTNVSNLDLAVNSYDDKFIDRFNKPRSTLEGMSKKFGFTIAGDFGEQVTLTTRNELMVDSGGNWWQYEGELPHAVANTETTSSYRQVLASDHELLTGKEQSDAHPSSSITHTATGGISKPIDELFNNKPFVSSYDSLQDALYSGRHIDLTGSDIDIDETVIVPKGAIVTGTGTMNVSADVGLSVSGSMDGEINLVESIDTFQNFAKLDKNNSLFESIYEGQVIRLVSTINSLSSDAGYFQLGKPTNTQISYFSEYKKIVAKSSDGTIYFSVNTSFPYYPITAGSTTPTGRQKSVVQIIDFSTAFIGDGVKFNVVDDITAAIRTNYCERLMIKNIDSNFNLFTGAYAYIQNSIMCRETANSYKLDASVKMNYGSVNPDARPYYYYNALKFVGSQNCISSKMYADGASQTFDVTYVDAPSLNCIISDAVVYNARVNAGTTHAGSFGTQIKNSTFIDCERGLSLRSRADLVSNCDIINSQGSKISQTTQNSTYGICVAEGFNYNTSIRNSTIQGYYRGAYVSDTKGGFVKNNIKFSNVNIKQCHRTITVAINSTTYGNENPAYKTEGDRGLVFEKITCSHPDGVFDYPVFYADSEYSNGVKLIDFDVQDPVESPSDYYIKFQENNKNITVEGWKIPSIGKLVSIGAITDTETLGDNTLSNMCVSIPNGSNKRVATGGSLGISISDFNVGYYGIADHSESSGTIYVDDIEDYGDLIVDGLSVVNFGNRTGSDYFISNLLCDSSSGLVILRSSSMSSGSSVYLRGDGNVYASEDIKIPSTTGLILFKNSGNGKWCTIG